MKDKETAEEELKRKLEESFQESIRNKEIFGVADGIMDLFDNSNLTPIEIFGILEMVKQTIHRGCICDECAKKGVDL